MDQMLFADSANPLAAVAGLYAHMFLHDYGRYLAWAFGVYFLIWRLFSRRLAERKIRRASAGGEQMRREFLASTRTAAIFALSGVLIVIGERAGIMQTYAAISERGWPYFWFSLAALIVLHDAWFYWTHRLIHDPRLFRRLHRTHHRSNNPTPLTAYSFDSGEAAINAAFMPLAAMAMPLSVTAIALFLMNMIARNVIGHSGYELFPARRCGRPLFDFLTTITHHDLHHAQAGWNYGLYFTWWDRICGTEHPLYHEKFAEAVRTPLDGSAVRALGLTPDRATALISAAAVASAALFFANAGQAVAAQSEDPLIAVAGVWATEGHGAHVALRRCADDEARLCGQIVWSWDPEVAASWRERLMLGDFLWNGEAFDDGWLANPEDGRTYRGKITLIADGALSLKGCAFVFCKSQIWRRIEAIPGCLASKPDQPPAAQMP
jgi:sterol desaturase/sphingolipid hydroxylase (fatty acid hydroxylase superfamily)/uncharacterized protein (DUF2147 family)